MGFLGGVLLPFCGQVRSLRPPLFGAGMFEREVFRLAGIVTLVVASLVGPSLFFFAGLARDEGEFSFEATVNGDLWRP